MLRRRLPARGVRFEYRPTLCFDIVTKDVASRIERDAWGFPCCRAHAADSGEKQQLAHPLRVRETHPPFRRARALERFTHLPCQ